MAPSGTFMQIRDLYLQKRQIGQRLKREVFNFACETFIVIVDGIEWVATVPRRSKPDDLVSMRFSAGNEVERTLVGMLGSGAKEESLKRYIREGLAMKTNEYKERVVSAEARVPAHMQIIKNAAALPPAAAEWGLPGSQHAAGSLPEHSSGLCTMPGVPARSTALSEHAASSFALHLCATSVITSQAASAADRTMTTGGDAAMVDPVKHGGTGDAGEYGVSEDGTEVSGAGQSNGLAPSEAGEQSEELVHRGFGVCNETRKRKRAPNMTRLVADDEEQQREMDRGHNDTDDAAPRYPRMAGQQDELPLPSPRFPCTVRQQEGGASATVQLPPPAPGDAHGGEAAALPSPSAAGPAAIAGPQFPCTVRQQEGGASATVQLPPPAPEDARGDEAAALPSPSAAGPAAIASPRFLCTVRQQEGGASATVQLPPTAPGDTHGGEAAAQAADERRLLPNDEAHLEREIHRMAGDKAAAIFQRGDLPAWQGGLPWLTHEGRLRLSNGTGRRMMVKLDKPPFVGRRCTWTCSLAEGCRLLQSCHWSRTSSCGRLLLGQSLLLQLLLQQQMMPKQVMQAEPTEAVRQGQPGQIIFLHGNTVHAGAAGKAGTWSPHLHCWPMNGLGRACVLSTLGLDGQTGRVAPSPAFLHLPSCKLDMKLHQLLHLAERIEHLGPSFTTAMWGYESLWNHLVKLMKNKQYSEATCMRSWIHKESVILAAERLPEGLCSFEPPQDAVSAGKLTHQQKAYWTVTNSTGPSVDTISRNAAIGFKQARRETLPEGFLLEMHETYLRHSTDYSDLFGVFTAWLWEQWTDDTTPGPFLSDYLSHLRLRTHSRRTLLHRDSHGSVSMRNKVLAKCCLSELWCQDVWVQPGLLLGSKPVSGIHLAGRFLEKLVAIKLNNNVALTAFDSNKPKTSQACWFITRRCNSSDKMWAGKVLGLYRYRLPLNRDKFDVVLEVEWHAPLLGNNSDAEVAVDQFMNVPLVDARAASVSNTGSRYYLAEDVAPCRVHILPHPSKRGALCVLSRSYSFMRVAGWEALQPQTPWARSR
ncbi:jordan transposition protein [Volvox carteri f. nagariensis]|uniref:Jordan transposition protein n=1 Tax=Volvox carteri f. nagariensis TaxID=3068 RepID=D8TLG8_VOLCA|nr:jordan transposition protein [Volvox carteri f. nagariensis]EFJ51732.1 jordan transposition protein [Volvox carteri f. nagariensis]|eukprot:XP_002947142.1 jordan transposition protein [Volvox carteri f. nagariensis]